MVGMANEPAYDPETVTSQTLLLRVRDPEDVEAWNSFVQRYAPRVLAWCRQNQLQDSDAADVTQEVLCKLITAMQQFEYNATRGRFRGWLKTVTANAVTDSVRRWNRSDRTAAGQGRGQMDLFEAMVDQRSTDQLAQAIESGYREELLEQAERLVRERVQPRTWQAYAMAGVEQQTASQVAEMLGIRVSEVYVAKSRVIKLLRKEVARLRAVQGLDDD